MDVEVVPGGKRRIDKVLAEDYLADITSLSLTDVRSLRDEADQEETDLSYLRRLLQGRVDLVAAEVRRRGAGEDSELVGQLPSILADETPRQQAFGLGRHQATEPTNAGASRRAEEKLAAVDVTDLGSGSCSRSCASKSVTSPTPGGACRKCSTVPAPSSPAVTATARRT
jgi:hypothetical protein